MDERGARILVVDDDLFAAELTSLVLEASGCHTAIAEGGVDALEKLAGDPLIGMVISDMNMPFMDGAQLFKELRQQGDARPFVLLTGHDAEPLRIAHPDIDAVLAKDEHFQETLPELVRLLLAKQEGQP
jgi:CheY-like chemotaxis protein